MWRGCLVWNLFCVAAAKCTWNQNAKLEPPTGGWRGAVVDHTRFKSVAEWESTYGFPLHMKRVFKGNHWQKLTDDELDFVKGGGIIMYTIPISPPTKFTDFIGPQNAWRIKQFIDVISRLSPARVMISIRYEPSFWVDPSNPKKYCGTHAEYRSMWKTFQDEFSQAGVTNAVWAMDYSTLATHPDAHPLIAALWPGDGMIDWLLFNMFQFGNDKKRTWLDMFETAYYSFENLSSVPQTYEGRSYTANYKTAPYWGLGAWGAEFRGFTEEQRAQYIEDSIQGFSGKYPRMKTEVYFDTIDEKTGSGSSIRDGQKAAYKKLNGLDFFTQNDNCSSSDAEPIVV